MCILLDLCKICISHGSSQKSKESEFERLNFISTASEFIQEKGSEIDIQILENFAQPNFLIYDKDFHQTSFTENDFSAVGLLHFLDKTVLTIFFY